MHGLKSGYRKAVYLWISMVFSLFVYALVVEIVRTNPIFLNRPSPLPETETWRYIFVFSAIGQFFLIGFIRNQTFSVAQARKQDNNGGPLSYTVSKLLNASILTNVLCELVAIYGLVLFFLAKNLSDFYMFLVLSFIYFVFYFPGYAQWERSARAVAGIETLRILGR
jgi:magnesium-transporting ATPase (P-type)